MASVHSVLSDLSNFFLLNIYLLGIHFTIPGLLELLLVHLREIGRLVEVPPVFTVSPCVCLELLAVRHDVAHDREERYQDKVNESWLTLRDPSCVPITQERYGKVVLLLDVSLVEEFFVEELSPFDCSVKTPGLS